jgi:hypothetical protein
LPAEYTSYGKVNHGILYLVYATLGKKSPI